MARPTSRRPGRQAAQLQGRRHRRCGILERVAERHRQDHQRWCGRVLARQHLDRVRQLRRQGHVLPDSPVRRAAGRSDGQPGHRGRFKNVAILARQDSYGEGLAKQVKKGIEEKPAPRSSAKELYSADATNYTAEVNKIAGKKPDAVVLIGFKETTKIIPTMIAKSVGPKDLQVYFVDGNTADYSRLREGRPRGRQGDVPGSPR